MPESPNNYLPSSAQSALLMTSRASSTPLPTSLGEDEPLLGMWSRSYRSSDWSVPKGSRASSRARCFGHGWGSLPHSFSHASMSFIFSSRMRNMAFSSRLLLWRVVSSLPEMTLSLILRLVISLSWAWSWKASQVNWVESTTKSYAFPIDGAKLLTLKTYILTNC